jgi:hypothetical protein
MSSASEEIAYSVDEDCELQNKRPAPPERIKIIPTIIILSPFI